MRNYIVLEDGYVQYMEGNVLYTIPNDPTNSDYAQYLRWLENPDAEEFAGGTL